MSNVVCTYCGRDAQALQRGRMCVDRLSCSSARARRLELEQQSVTSYGDTVSPVVDLDAAVAIGSMFESGE